MTAPKTVAVMILTMLISVICILLFQEIVLLMLPSFPIHRVTTVDDDDEIDKGSIYFPNEHDRDVGGVQTPPIIDYDANNNYDRHLPQRATWRQRARQVCPLAAGLARTRRRTFLRI